MFRRSSSSCGRSRRLATAAAGLLAAVLPLAAADSAAATGPNGYFWPQLDEFGYGIVLWCETTGNPMVTPTIGCWIVLDWWDVAALHH